MTWQTTAVRYISVGERSARFRDLTLRFDSDGEPVESVIWLPNGGGKSSLMALQSAVVLPAARDFTGAGREDGERRPRRLEDYIATGDTSHTVIEWASDNVGDLLGGRNRLLTGVVYEWPNRTHPAVDQNVQLTKLWWSAVPIPGLLDIDVLPVRDGRLLTLMSFQQRLRDLNAEHPELQVQFARVQNDWEKRLGDLDIDTALHRYQARMNTSEGGIAKIFTFNTVKDFIDLVVDVIATPEQAQDCGNIVNRHATNLFRGPTLVVERRFLEAAGHLLSKLGSAHDRVVSATRRYDEVTAAAVRLRASLLAAATEADERASQLLVEAEATGERANLAQRRRVLAEAVRAEAQLWAADKRQTDAEAQVVAACDAKAAAAVDEIAWSVAGALAEADAHAAAATEIRRQLAPEREAREQLRRRIDAHAIAARAGLERRASESEERARTAGEESRRNSDDQAAIAKKLLDLRAELTQIAAVKAKALAQIEAHELSIADLRNNDVIGEDEGCADALQRHSDAARVASEDAAGYAADEETLRAQSSQKGEEEKNATREHGELATQARELGDDEGRLRESHDSLARNERLIALAEADGTIDPWGDAAQLQRALIDASHTAEASALLVAVEAAEDKRLVTGVETDGFLPAPAATAAVAAKLVAAGVTADTAWHVLGRDYEEAHRARAARARPEVVTGVLVQDDEARTRALAALVTDPATALIPIVTATELKKAAEVETGGASDFRAVPLHDGLHSAAAAESTTTNLRSSGDERDRLRAEYTASARRDQQLAEQISGFVNDYPDAQSLVVAAQKSQRAKAAADAKLEEALQLHNDCERLAREARSVRTAAERAKAAAHKHDTSIALLRPVAVAEPRMAEHNETIRLAESSEGELGDQVGALEVQASKLVMQAGDLRSTQEKHDQAANAARDRARRLTTLDPEREPDGELVSGAMALALEACISAHEELLAHWSQEASTSVLEVKLRNATDREEESCARAERAISGFGGDRQAVRDIGRSRSLHYDVDTCRAEELPARQAHEAAIASVSNAEAEMKIAKTAFDEARRARARHARSVDRVEFQSPAEADHRVAELTVEIADLSSTETNLRAQRSEIEQHAKDHTSSAGILRDQMNLLPGADEPDLPERTPFPGDVDAARRASATAASACAEAAHALGQAKTDRQDLQASAVRLANDPQYREVILTLRDRLSDSDPIRLGIHAHEYRTQAETRSRQVSELLEQIAADEERVGQLVATHVRQLISSLSAAARASKLPPHLGAMSGRQFLSIRFDNPTEQELISRVTQHVLTLLNAAGGLRKSLPSGARVLRECVHAAVGVKGFRVDVLKPNEHFLEQKVPITDVGRFSDGEKLTACVLLYCAFAHMRQRSRRSGGATGTLMLDNPFGRASTAQLVALQLSVAQAQRVHLVYATGLEDVGALAQFRNIIRLRNRKPVGSTSGYVQLEGERVVNGVRVSRPSAPTPPGIDDASTVSSAPSAGGEDL